MLHVLPHYKSTNSNTTIVQQVSRNSNEASLSPISTPLIFNYPIVRGIAHEEDSVIYFISPVAFKHTSLIVLPVGAADSNCDRTILQQTNHLAIVEIVHLLWNVSKICFFPCPANERRCGQVRRIRIVRLQWDSACCLLEYILQISSLTCTFRGTTQKILLRQVNVKSTLIFQHQPGLAISSSCKCPTTSAFSLIFYGCDHTPLSPIQT